MNREDLIKKWLDHDLDPQEQEAFNALEDSKALEKLDRNLKAFKSPEFEPSEYISEVMEGIENGRTNSLKWLSTAIKIAAVFVVCFGIYFLIPKGDTTVSTLIAQKETISLPDASIVELNAASSLVFNSDSWDDKREVLLTGEAFFKVAKGSKFDVKTSNGLVTVLGTQFNVKQRPDYFHVVCYEGSVAVTFNKERTTLAPGEAFLILDGKFIATEKENQSIPSWLQNQSKFKSMPFKEVLAEFERQHNVSIILENIDDTQLFSGSFTHNDIEIALKSITLPLHLTYSKTDDIITLKSEQ